MRRCDLERKDTKYRIDFLLAFAIVVACKVKHFNVVHLRGYHYNMESCVLNKIFI
jgi:hypothetical protein